jgi:hypothetical protein
LHTHGDVVEVGEVTLLHNVENHRAGTYPVKKMTTATSPALLLLAVAAAIVAAAGPAAADAAAVTTAKPIPSAATTFAAAKVVAAPYHAEGAVAQSLAITDMAGKGLLKRLKPNTQFLVTLTVANTDTSQVRDYMTVLEARDANGFTVSLSIGEGILGAGQTISTSKALSFDEPGTYTFRAFALSSPAIGFGAKQVAVSPVITSTVSASQPDNNYYPGVYVPLYKYPDLDDPAGVWNAVIKAKGEHHAVPFVVTINPWSGPGDWRDPIYVKATAELRKAGVEYVLGYISTGYARQYSGGTLAELEKQIDDYRAWYPEVNGVMFDEMSSDAGQFQFYKELAGHARAQGMEFVMANPGTRPDEQYTSIFDNLLVYEDVTLPSALQVETNTYWPRHSPEGFSIAVRDVPRLDPAYIDDIKDFIGLLFLTDAREGYGDGDGNPYDVLPSYFGDLVRLLDPNSP